MESAEFETIVGIIFKPIERFNPTTNLSFFAMLTQEASSLFYSVICSLHPRHRYRYDEDEWGRKSINLIFLTRQYCIQLIRHY